MWAVGCIFAELLTLKPLFQGVEAKATPNPFQVWALALIELVLPSCFQIISLC
jgi:cyclin-dependent kinase 8/11